MSPRVPIYTSQRAGNPVAMILSGGSKNQEMRVFWEAQLPSNSAPPTRTNTRKVRIRPNQRGSGRGRYSTCGKAMRLQANQAEGKTNTPANARLAAIMKDCVRSELPDNSIKDFAPLYRAMIAAAPKRRKAARTLETSWMSEGQLYLSFDCGFEISEVDIVGIINPRTG
jgi:hypothetical protein